MKAALSLFCAKCSSHYGLNAYEEEMTMLAAVLKKPGELVLENVPTPAPGPDEVVVRVIACGFCATDYKAITGARTNVTYPAILGHEPAGVVASVGRAVTHFSKGDEVIVQPSGYCGMCERCREGKWHYCEHGFTTGGDGAPEVWPGAFAEYLRAKEIMLFRKPKNVSFDAAAITEPLSGAWKGVIEYSQLSIGEDVVVIGVGGIGLLVLMVAKVAGAGILIAIDPSEYALENAKRLGATHTINPRLCDPVAEVREIVPKGPDLVIEAAGPIEAVRLMRDLRRRGTRMNLFGITTHEEFSLDGGQTHFLETRMDASFGTTPRAMLRAIRLMERGLVDPGKIISHRYPLSEIHKAVQVMGTSERNKVVINP